MKDTRNPSLIAKVRTRVAPSPTGDPHVGTAFQALLNQVFAHRYEGQFLLRIEDTDQKRFVASSEEVIFDALEWLELTPDESVMKEGAVGPYRQSERLEIYQKYAQQLVDEGKAYYCFCSSERLTQMREEQQKQKVPPKYDRACRNLSKEEVAKRLAAGEKAVIRLKVPDNQEIVVHDVLRGEVKFDSNIIDDQVLMKSDGFPTYHLAVVVDDHLMGITHMMRGEEWLPSAPKHVLLYQYFGWSEPIMIHTPVLRNPDRSKLSKRKGNTSLWWYRGQGFLKEALLNFLALLVWKPSDQREIFTKEEMMANFEWEQLQVTGPIFDTTKLLWLNGMYMRQLSLDELLARLEVWMAWVTKHATDEKLLADVKALQSYLAQNASLFKQALALAQERLKVFAELKDLIDFYFETKLTYDQKDLLQKHQAEEVVSALRLVKQRLNDLSAYTAENWEKTIRATADELGFSHKDLFMCLRSAVTARKFTPPLFEVMQVLGKEESNQRIEQAIAFLL